MEFNDGLPLDGSSCLLLPDQIGIWSVGSLPCALYLSAKFKSSNRLNLCHINVHAIYPLLCTLFVTSICMC